MSRKSKGLNAERDLVRAFWARGWAAIRSAGSGSSHYPSPDLLVGKEGRRLAIECKLTSDDKKYLSKEEIEQLRYFSQLFGAETWVAVKFSGLEWHFILPEDMVQTPRSYAIGKEQIQEKGISLEEFFTLHHACKKE
ncbi:MAG: Holliday junction resolvase [Nanoarchaeota archaeon]|nr:Holliday junction resolvase [Nanoarchaeota archaeon]